MPNERDMTTAATAAERLGVSAGDTVLAALITAASSALAKYLGYEAHWREEVVETVPSQGRIYLFLRAGAVKAISSIEVGGAVLDPSHYHLESGPMGRLVARGGYRWPFTGEHSGGVSPVRLRTYDTGEIVCTFSAGWVTPGQVALAAAESPPRALTSDMPPELEQAALETVTAWYLRKGQDAGITSMSTGDASVGWGGDSLQGARAPLPLPARVLADSYRKPTRRVS